jgi:hypothetical protein
LHHAEALVPGLPLPDWLSLSETENLVKQKANADSKEIREALERAFRDENVKSKGKCRQHFRHDVHVILEGFHWHKAVVDWSASSFLVRLGKTDIFEENFPSNPPFQFEDILVYRPDVLRWLENTPGTEAEANNAKNPGGRPQKWDWEGALIAIIRVADLDGLPQGPGAQAQIGELISDWFVKTTGNHPSESQIRQYASRIAKAVGAEN